jgi:hypothetical protein
MADAVAAALLPVSRQDRSVVARVVASEGHVKAGERYRSKTLMTFQHTMTGSDLLFMTVLLEEHGNSMEVTYADSNGLYEESYAGERAAVEQAVFEGLLAYARGAGFAQVRLNKHEAGTDSSLFYLPPSDNTWKHGDAEATWERAVSNSRHAGHVTSSSWDGRGMVAKLRVSGEHVPDVTDMACKVASGRDAILALMANYDYRFDSLQTAKFSSMMIVYQLAKGWKKEGHHVTCNATTRRGHAVHESDEDLEEEDEEEEVVQRPSHVVNAHAVATNNSTTQNQQSAGVESSSKHRHGTREALGRQHSQHSASSFKKQEEVESSVAVASPSAHMDGNGERAHGDQHSAHEVLARNDSGFSFDSLPRSINTTFESMMNSANNVNGLKESMDMLNSVNTRNGSFDERSKNASYDMLGRASYKMFDNSDMMQCGDWMSISLPRASAIASESERAAMEGAAMVQTQSCEVLAKAVAMAKSSSFDIDSFVSQCPSPSPVPAGCIPAFGSGGMDYREETSFWDSLMLGDQ